MSLCNNILLFSSSISLHLHAYSRDSYVTLVLFTDKKLFRRSSSGQTLTNVSECLMHLCLGHERVLNLFGHEKMLGTHKADKPSLLKLIFQIIYSICINLLGIPQEFNPPHVDISECPKRCQLQTSIPNYLD